MQKLRTMLLFSAVFIFTSHILAATQESKIALQKKQFINQLVTQDHFDQKKLTAIFKHFYENKEIVKQMSKPFEKESWDRYQSFFITPTRIHLGVAYWYVHHAMLHKIKKQYGVPASIIIAIIGVESAYGLHMGEHSIANTLYTLAFYYPKRSAFFKKELREFFLLTRDNHLPLLSLKGSYAGALGIPQFMPSSYRHYGVSASKHQKVDLFRHHDDAIASVANFLTKNGWKARAPIAKKVSSKRPPSHTSIVKFKEKNAPVTWQVYHNFHVIMRYNHSPSYAMVITLLAQAIQKEYVINEHQKKSCITASTRPIRFS